MTTLYKINKNKSIQSWSIEAVDDSFIVTFGQLNGSMQIVSTKCYSMNKGRSNETTPDQQAILEMESLIAKKIKSGYSYEISDTPTVMLPMKVKCYQDQLHNIKFPCISTIKLNGVNGIYRRDTDGTKTLTLTSRGGEIYPPIPHLESAVHDAMNKLKSDELNGELYIHGEHLQNITSAVLKPKKSSKLLSFCIFDIADSHLIYHERRVMLMQYLKFNPTIPSSVCTIVGSVCLCTEDIETYYEKAMQAGFEGTVIKNLSGLYQHNVRSSDQFKYKKAQSAEFRITGYELDKRNHPVFLLITPDQAVFKAKPKGSHEFLTSINPDEYVNQWGTVEYEVLSASNVPLKPIFIALRKCDAEGNPLM